MGNSKKFQILILFTIVLSAALLVFFYIGWNITIWFHSIGYEVSLVSCTVVPILMICSYILSRLPFLPVLIRKPFTWLGSFSFFWLEWLMIMLPLANSIVWLSKWFVEQAAIDVIVQWIGIMILLILSLSTIVGVYYARTPFLRKVTIPISKSFPDGRDVIRILVASDLHIGHLVGKKHIQRLVHLAHTVQPDLIVFAGDVLDDDVRPFLDQQMDQLLAQMKAPHGIYAVLGNHEYYGGGIERYVKSMQAVGIPVLQDEIIELEGIGTLIGRKDLTANSFPGSARLTRRKTMEQLITEVDISKPIIMLDHQPKELRIADQVGVDVIISGHTHRGQFWPNHILTRKIFDLDYGDQSFGYTHAVVSSGWGTWGPPVRIGSQCEAVLIEITSKK